MGIKAVLYTHDLASHHPQVMEESDRCEAEQHLVDGRPGSLQDEASRELAHLHALLSLQMEDFPF